MKMNQNELRIEKVEKSVCEKLLNEYHYLNKQGFGFRSGHNFGLFLKDRLIGVAVFHTVSAPETVQGCFGLERNEQYGIWELGRLVIHPDYNGQNYTSWFLARAIKRLRKEAEVRALISYADADYHKGYIYQATNFKYFGMTNKKKDFWRRESDGTYVKQSRGRTKGVEGEWRNRSRKHRYMLVYDQTLKTKWKEEPYPKGEQLGPIEYDANGCQKSPAVETVTLFCASKMFSMVV